MHRLDDAEVFLRFRKGRDVSHLGLIALIDGPQVKAGGAVVEVYTRVFAHFVKVPGIGVATGRARRSNMNAVRR